MSETSTPDPTPDGVDQPATGWKLIASNQSVVDMVDCLLGMPPHREFNKTELAELADVSRRSVHTHLDLLLTVGIIEEVPATSPQRYRLNTDSDVTEALIKLDGALNNAGPHADEST